MSTARSSAVVLLSIAAAIAACNDKARCDGANCEFSDDEIQLLRSISGLGDPPPDPSNRYIGDACAQDLGHRFFFDPQFSGTASGAVDAIGRKVPYSRAPKGQPLNLSCASCHDLLRSGSDTASEPPQISVGAGWSAVNALHLVNAQYYPLPFWNGRDDSLWAMIIGVVESATAMSGNRVELAHRIFDDPVYRAEYAKVFADNPLPFDKTSQEIAQMLDASGHCLRDPMGACPSDACRVEMFPDGSQQCVLRFPLKGKPGKLHPTCTEDPNNCCQRGKGEPFDDAFDCMDKGDRDQINRVIVDFAKAIAAFEYQLVSRSSLFDRAIAGQDRLSDSAVRGARLFIGKASCIECHNTPLLSDGQYHNTGVPQVGPNVPTEADCPAGGTCDCQSDRPPLPDCGSQATMKEPAECPPWGFYDGLRKLRINQTWRRYAKYSDDTGDDSRQSFCDMSSDDSLKGAWRTPSLRDVALTAPYMHDGVFDTLSEVVDYYNWGGSSMGSAVGQKSPKMKPLHLTVDEEADLVELLTTFTGEPLDPALTAHLTDPPPASCTH
jgi:cytochrome c peroxidase